MVLDGGLRATPLVMGGGAIGSLARWLVALLLNRGIMPRGTLAVNLAGSFLIALPVVAGAPRTWINTEERLLLATGLLAGFTTMSAFTLDPRVPRPRGGCAGAKWRPPWSGAWARPWRDARWRTRWLSRPYRRMR